MRQSVKVAFLRHIRNHVCIKQIHAGQVSNPQKKKDKIA